MSLLTIVQNVCGLLALPVPAAVVGSTDKQVIQLFQLLNEQGDDLASVYPWQAIVKEQLFTTTASAAQATAIPVDFDRFMPNTFFNRTTRRPMTGPITARQWQWIQAQPVYSTVYLAFRERTNQYLVAPNAPLGQTIAYEYVSANWAISAGGVGQTSYQADTDLTYLDESLMKLGLRWRFLAAKGLPYSEEMQSYERNLEQSMARDGGSTMITLNPQPIDPNRVNLPDGNFGVP